MNIPIIGGVLAVAVSVGLIMRSNPTLSSTDARVILNGSVHSATLVGAKVVSEHGGSVVLAGADGIQINAYGNLPENAGIQGDATLSKNGNSWSLVKFKSYSSAAQTGTLQSIRQRPDGTVYGVINSDAGGQVRVKFNDSGAWK